MTWVVMRTDTFLESFKTVKKNKDVLAELDKKLIRLSENPLHVGGGGVSCEGIILSPHFCHSFLFTATSIIQYVKGIET